MKRTNRSVGRFALVALAFISLLGVRAGASAEVFSSFVTIEPPGSVYGSLAWAISPSGEIVGVVLDTANGAKFHGFRLDRSGTYRRVDVPGNGDTSTSVRGVNARGDIVGYYTDTTGTHGFVWKKNAPAPAAVDFPGANSTEAFGINARGDIVGRHRVGATSHGFLLRGDPAVAGNYVAIDAPFSDVTLTLAIAINAGGDIAGQYRTAGDPKSHGFVLRNGEFTTIDVPVTGAVLTSANGMDSEGFVVGPYDVGTVRHAYRWRDGEFVLIDLQGAKATHAAGINPQGEIVGYYVDGNDVNHGYFLVDVD